MKPRGYWTEERLYEAAKPYSSRKDFRQGNHAAYVAAVKIGLHSKIFSDVPRLTTEPNFWNEDRIKEESLKYKTRSEFAAGCRPAYNAAKRLGIFEEVCSHMVRLGHEHFRCVYEIANHEQKVIYIGLTCDVSRRQMDHKANARMKNNFPNGVPDLKIIVDFCKIEEAVEWEKFWIDFYRESNYKVINCFPGGGLGGNRVKWTEDKLFDEALKYPTRVSFQRGSPAAYAKARRSPNYEEMCKHMVRMRVPNGYWTTETARTEYLKYGNRRDFKKNCCGAYSWACRNNCIDEVCKDE